MGSGTGIAPDHVPGVTVHARRGAVRHQFRYWVDYVLLDPDSRAGPSLFSRNRVNLFSVRDKSHGGPPGRGRGATWAREILQEAGLAPGSYDLRLLTQPGFCGYVFNPVSFWLAFRGTGLVAVIAEVTNTFGDRHSYLCHMPELTPIGPKQRLSATKILHVSPFQPIAGAYHFAFNVTGDRIAIRIEFDDHPEGLVATLSGPRLPLTNRALLGAALRRPLGALRGMALIHWQALRLKLKGAPYRTRPTPPMAELSRTSQNPDGSSD